MKIDEWCQMHSITKTNYYWRLRKARETFLEAADITVAGVESGRNVGFAGVTGDLEAGNNNNLA